MVMDLHKPTSLTVSGKREIFTALLDGTPRQPTTKLTRFVIFILLVCFSVDLLQPLKFETRLDSNRRYALAIDFVLAEPNIDLRYFHYSLTLM